MAIDPSELHEAIDKNNRDDQAIMEMAADVQRARMITSAASSIKKYWQLQTASFDEIASRDYPQDATLDYIVLPTYTGFPFHQEEPVAAWCMRLEPQPEPIVESSAESEPDRSALMLYVPVPEDTVFDEMLDVDEIPEPTQIAAAFTFPSGYTVNFVIDLSGTDPFVDVKEGGDEDDVFLLHEQEMKEFLSDAQFIELQSDPKSKIKIKEDVEIIPLLLNIMF